MLQLIAKDVAVKPGQVEAVINLLEEEIRYHLLRAIEKRLQDHLMRCKLKL